jgi:hypothetical protein
LACWSDGSRFSLNKWRASSQSGNNFAKELKLCLPRNESVIGEQSPYRGGSENYIGNIFFK